jgi:hypothetical protein
MVGEQTFVWFTSGTAVVAGIVIFAVAFLIGFLVGHRWPR